ncbi:hypothetical protein HYY70_07135 [Candidatus Woesearchaeota archaeon]|nr:hypothetical protein [Candidatus Woesearchaeota archaeon]
MQMIQSDLQSIVDFYSTIISKERVGSRFEAHDVKKIWKLGDMIISTIKPLDLTSLLPKLDQIHKIKSIRYRDMLYRAAITFRRYWQEETQYKEVVNYLNIWRKLRAFYPVCEEILKGDAKYTINDVDNLIKQCKDKTAEEIIELTKRLRKKDDKILEELRIDLYEFRESLINVSDELLKIIEEDSKTENELRKIYSPEQLRAFRLLLSALQKEEVYLKHNQGIKKTVKKVLSQTDLEIGNQLNEIFNSINRFINNEKARILVRKEIPVTFIGNLSTYLRAVESDANKEQYKKNKEILNKFIGKMSS